jgi:hypothetical protein
MTGAKKAFSDMGRSLGLMAVVIAGLLLLGPARTLVFPGDAEWQGYDPSGSLTAFERASGVTPLRPEGVPDTWRVNASSAVHRSGYDQLHIGFAVPGSAYAGLDELAGNWQPALEELGVEVGPVPPTMDINGRRWMTLRSARGEEALVAKIGDLFVVITGDASDTQLQLLAASLR